VGGWGGAGSADAGEEVGELAGLDVHDDTAHEAVDVEGHGDVGDVDAVELQVEGEGLAEEVARLHLEDVTPSGGVEGPPPPLEEFALRHDCFIAA
jgi:hypothetical protein